MGETGGLGLVSAARRVGDLACFLDSEIASSARKEQGVDGYEDED